MPQRYFLSADEDGHWFVVPLDKTQEWHKWRDLDQDSEEAWEPPAWASPVDGNPSRVTFENPLLP